MKKTKDYEVIIQGKVSKIEKQTLVEKLKPMSLTVSGWIRKQAKDFIKPERKK